MTSDRNGKVPILVIKKGDSLKTIYAKYRRAFTAADLQKYTEIEEGIPLEQILAELKASDAKEAAKKKQVKSKKKARPHGRTG
jgi:hypothetical protein